MHLSYCQRSRSIPNGGVRDTGRWAQKRGEKKTKSVLIQSIVDQNKSKSDGVSGSCILLIAAHLKW